MTEDGCQHLRTTVIDSRHPDAVKSNGYAANAELPFPCLQIRRRKCFDCSAKFKTYEVMADGIEAMKALAKAEVSREILAEIADFALAKLEGRS